MIPKVGLKFVHARQLRKIEGLPVRDWPHMTCTVTRVTRANVYFRNETGQLSSVSRDRFDDAVNSTQPTPSERSS